MKILMIICILWLIPIIVLLVVGPRFSQNTAPYGPNSLETTFFFLTLPVALPMNLLVIHNDTNLDIGDKLPYCPRFINWVWSTWGGYFWLPCPICGQNFGGHEEPSGTIWSGSSGKEVCRNCIEEAKKTVYQPMSPTGANPSI